MPSIGGLQQRQELLLPSADASSVPQMLQSASRACLDCHAFSCTLRSSVSAASLCVSVCLLLLPYSLQALLESLRLLAIESAAHQKPLSYRGLNFVHYVSPSKLPVQGLFLPKAAIQSILLVVAGAPEFSNGMLLVTGLKILNLLQDRAPSLRQTFSEPATPVSLRPGGR